MQITKFHNKGIGVKDAIESDLHALMERYYDTVLKAKREQLDCNLDTIEAAEVKLTF